MSKDNSSIFSFNSFLKDKARTFLPVIVDLAVRMKFSTVMPGMEIGCWKDIKIPAFARSFTASSVISLPSKMIEPLSTVYVELPMIALASVDLPAPLVPITT